MPFTRESGKAAIAAQGTGAEISARLKAGRDAKKAQTGSERRKEVETAIWDVLSKGGLKKWLKDLKSEEPALFARMVDRFLPPTPKALEEAAPPTARDILGDTLEQIRAELVAETEAKLKEVW